MTYLLYLRVEILTVKSRNYRTHEILEKPAHFNFNLK